MAYAKKNGYKQQNAILLLDDNVPFQFEESFKMLRTNLMYVLAAANSKVILVTSANPDEGKSTLCSNLSIAMSQISNKVILIDADLRKPVQHMYFKIANRFGLSSLLGNIKDANINTTIRECTPNLHVMPAGPVPPNPSELLASTRMDSLLEFAEENFDYVFIDTAPINAVTDPLVLANKNLSVILGAYAGRTTQQDLAKALSSLELTTGKLLGVVVGGVRGGNREYYAKQHKHSR